LSGKRAAGSEGFGVGCGHGSDFLSPASFPAGRHPTRRVAVPSLHPSAPLAAPVLDLIEAGIAVRCLRDLTRGGLASALVEVAEAARLAVSLEEFAQIALAADVPHNYPIDTVEPRLDETAF